MSFPRQYGSHLSFKPEYAAAYKRFPGEDTGVIYKEAGGEIVTAVNNHIIILYKAHDIIRGQTIFDGLYAYVRVKGIECSLDGCRLGHTKGQGVVGDLSLEIAEFYNVIIYDSEIADPGGCEIKTDRAS